MRTQIIIPARLASSRLPRKLLRRVGGRSVLQWTHDAASRCGIGQPVVAVDDPELADEVGSFGGRVVMTSVDCASGTDRIAEAVEQLIRGGDDLDGADIIVNVQGDEPEIAPESIRRVAELLRSHPDADMSTLATPLEDEDRLSDPSVVKIAMKFDGPLATGWGRAVYFSRAAIPHDRDRAASDRAAGDRGIGKPQASNDRATSIHWHHIGLYAYRVSFLRWFATAPVGFLEQIEKLEQLRAIEAGKTIVVGGVAHATSGIDTAADLDGFAKRVQRAG